MAFSCDKCDLCKSNQGVYVKGKGDVKSRIFFIGSHPWTKDIIGGTPFLGDGGKLLTEVLEHANIKRHSVFTANLVRCGLPTNVLIPTPEQITACFTHLDKEMDFVKPKVVVLLGDVATQAVLGLKASAALGRVWDSSETKLVFNYAKPAKGVFKVVAGPDPIQGLESTSKRKDLEMSVDLAKTIAYGADTSHLPRNYKYAHTEEDVFTLLSEVLGRCLCEDRMTFDIETTGLVWFKRMFDPNIADVLSIAFCFRQREAYGLVLREKCISKRVLETLQAIMASPIRKAGHNGIFDNLMLRSRMGCEGIGNYDHDTMVAAHILDQSLKFQQLDLGTLALQIRPDFGRWWEPAHKFMDKVHGLLKCPDDVLLQYNCTDADATMALWDYQEAELKDRGKEVIFKTVAMPHLRELENIEYVGVLHNVEACKALGSALLAKSKLIEVECLKKIKRHPHWWGPNELKANGVTAEEFKPFNLGSTDQLAELIYKELKMPVVRTTPEGKPSADKEALSAMRDQHPFITELLEYRGIKKQLGSYIGWEAKPEPKRHKEGDLFGVEPWQPEGIDTESNGLLMWTGEDGRCHADFNICGTVTGRIAITKPALQTLPKVKEFRHLLIPRPGYLFVDADFKGLELRILALLSKDPAFLQIFKDGLDPHSVTASKMFGIPIKDFPEGTTKAERDAYFEVWNKEHGDFRKKAKSVNFGIPYGEAADGLAADLKVPKKEAQQWLDDWDKAYPVADKWLKKQVEDARKAKAITYSLNRERPLRGFDSKDKSEIGNAERQAKNTPIQGTGGDCCSISIARIHDRFRAEFGKDWMETARIVLEVHDQLVVEVKAELAEKVMGMVKAEMSRPMPMLPTDIPLEVDAEIQDKWGHKLEKIG